ncbi:MAG: alpha/beta hydrolase family protein, partial [Pyrinomonadaceae bacterium]
MLTKKAVLRSTLSLFLLLVISGAAQAKGGRLVREVVHGVSLEKTATGENPDRNVSIYLPPGYDTSPAKRFPVLYLLHGIAGNDEDWTKAWDPAKPAYATIQDVMDQGIAAGNVAEMIVVVPDESTKWFGSFYVNSTATGNWEDFTVRELVGYVDGKYRTIAQVGSRGIAGHSMGGYGALTLAMKHPDIFSVAYGMNPALIDWGGDLTIDNHGFVAVLKAKSLDELLKSNDIYTIGVLCVAQAFSPNPAKPPFFADLPFVMTDGKMQVEPGAFARWREHSATHLVARYRANLSRLRGIRFDSGYEDEFRFIPGNCQAFSNELTNNGIDHTFEEYNGDHRNRMWGRQGRL